MRIAILSIGLLFSATFSQSPSSMMGWGSEVSPVDGPSRAMGEAGSALRSDRAWDPRLEARSAYNTLAAFEVQIAPQVVAIDDGLSSNTLSGSRLPKVSLSFPLGRFGHLGFGYLQRFQKSFDWQSPTDSTVRLQAEGGAFEGVAGYSLVIPGLRNLAVGATYHRLLGSDRLFQQETRQFSDEYNSVVSRDSISRRYWGDYWSLSAYWTRGDFDAGVWCDLPGSVQIGTIRGASGQVFAESPDITVDAPASVGGSAAWRLAPKMLAVAQASRTEWDPASLASTDGRDPQWDLGMGGQYSMGGDRFDDYWKRMIYRAGLSASVGGPQSLLTEAATLGAGMPLGAYGTLDLSLQLGQNEIDDGRPKLKESFVRLYVAITGASLWGRSQRAHR
jgi:hypothetical protein